MNGMPLTRAAALGFVALTLAGCASGLHGVVQSSPGGLAIVGATLEFVREDGSTTSSATSGTGGDYSIGLSPGRYYARASHAAHEDTTTAPGFVVVQPRTRGAANFFLRSPQMTTVLLTRHGEKLEPNSNAQNEPLSAAGQARAMMLREALFRAGISAVYSTDTRRTRDTVAPLAAAFALPTRIYSDPAVLAAEVLADRGGDVVLVAAHSNTLVQVANAFGAQLAPGNYEDFDNLLVLAIGPAGTHVFNLQLGADSSPDITRNAHRAQTLLLVGTTAPGALPQQMLHALRKAAPAALFSSTAGNPLLAPVSAALGLPVARFDPTDPAAFVAQLDAAHAQAVVVVAAPQDDLRSLIRQLGAQPFPIIYGSDVDHLVAVTRFVSGGVNRVLPLVVR